MSTPLDRARRSVSEGQMAAVAETLAEDLPGLASAEYATQVAELLGECPGEPGVVEMLERVVREHPRASQVVLPACAALNRSAELRPADEPPFIQGPAHVAAGAAQQCFEALPAAERQDPEVGGYLQLNIADALRMMGPEYDDDALAAYRLALAIDDSKGGWWFNLGLLHKWRGRFEEGLEANRKALARLGEVRAVLWNLAVCATALGKGELAVEAWVKLGIPAEVNSAGMPFVPGLPPAEVRVASVGDDVGADDPLPSKSVSFEVLSMQPLSPCHGVVQTPTVRRASVDYGDVVLFDGAPVRVSERGGEMVPCFPLIWILRPGDERRLRFIGMQNKSGLIEELTDTLPDDVGLFVLDRRKQQEQEDEIFYGKLIVPAGRDLAALRLRLEGAVRERPGLTLTVPSIYELIGDTAAAGKAHQAWGGMERTAIRRGLLPG